MVALFVRSNNLSSQLDEVNGQLAASNTELQQTIADKETAQAELTTAQNDLREAQLVLEESTAKVAELEAQLVVLNDENEANKAQVETLTACYGGSGRWWVAAAETGGALTLYRIDSQGSVRTVLTDTPPAGGTAPYITDFAAANAHVR